MPFTAPVEQKPFQLGRWFALVGLLAIASISTVSGVLLSRFLTERMLHQEAVLTMEFIDNVMPAAVAAPFFQGRRDDETLIRALFEHVVTLRDVVRVSAHSPDRTVLWSTDQTLVGRGFDDNPELERALAGQLIVHGDRVGAHQRGEGKAEHIGLSEDVGYFVEMYVPMRDESGKVIGALELYKSPQALFEAIQTGELAIGVGAAASGLFLYLVMFWRIRRADALIREQQERLVQNETLAAIGEMGSAVAHGIRNPLAAIRSSAELVLDTPDADNREAASDIVAEVDRLEMWVHDLLSYARPVTGPARPVDIAPLVRDCLTEYEREAGRRGIVTHSSVDADLPPVSADPLLLAQVLGSLLVNAFEALEQGGSVAVTAARQNGRVRLAVSDTGPGIAADKLPRIFKPFYTSKAKGLGVGLPLAKRIVERFGGEVRVTSVPGQHTEIALYLPAVTPE